MTLHIDVALNLYWFIRRVFASPLKISIKESKERSGFVIRMSDLNPFSILLSQTSGLELVNYCCIMNHRLQKARLTAKPYLEYVFYG